MYLVKERPYKESIVEAFYNLSIEGPVVVTTLAGPDFERVIMLANEKLAPIEINSYEIEDSIYNSQIAQHSFLPQEVRDITNVYNLNIDLAPVSNFIDVDLMGTVLTQFKIMQNLLNQQKYLSGDKCFIGTFSLRPVGLQDTLNQIRNLISLALNSRVQIRAETVFTSNERKFSYCNKQIAKYMNRIITLDVFHYSDGTGPMVTFRLFYN